MQWLSWAKSFCAQRNAVNVSRQIVIRGSADQSVRRGIQAERGFNRIKDDVVILGGVRVIKRQSKARMIAKAEAERSLARVAHGDAVADAAAFQRIGAAQGEIIREIRIGFLAGGQLERQLVCCLTDEPMLKVAGKAMLTTLVNFAILGKEVTAGQLAA